jgi:hypothetical protein
MKYLLLSLVALCSSPLFAADDWIKISETDNATWEGRKGSLEKKTTKGGVNVIVAQGRIFNKKTKAIEFEQWYVSVDDCNAKQGKLVTLTLSGDYKLDNDFVENGGTVASSLADMLCYGIKQAKLKGI